MGKKIPELPAIASVADEDLLIAEDISATSTGKISLAQVASLARQNMVTADDLADHAGLSTTAHGGIVSTGDARLTDARTPLAHKTSHATGGSDALTAADIGAAAASHTHNASAINAGTLAAARLPAATETARGGVVLGADTLGIITAITTVYVSTTGNDTTGDGSEAAPFLTLIRAMEWLSMRRIASTAFVTVQLGAGVFTLSSGISLDHVDGARITIRGRGMGDGTGDTTRLHLTSGRITVTSRLAICNLEISHASNVSGTWVVLVDGNAAFLTLGVTNQNEPVRIRSGNYGVFVINQAMFRMYGGEVLDFTGRGISADRNTFVSLYGNTYPITIDPNSAGSGTVAGTIGISAATAAMVQRVGTVNILDCTTPTSADAYSAII